MWIRDANRNLVNTDHVERISADTYNQFNNIRWVLSAYFTVGGVTLAKFTSKVDAEWEMDNLLETLNEGK